MQIWLRFFFLPSLYCRWSAGTLRRIQLGRRSSLVKPMCLCSCSTPRPWTSACQATSPGATPSSLRWWLRPLWTATRETVCKCRAGEIIFNQNLKEQLLLKRKIMICHFLTGFYLLLYSAAGSSFISTTHTYYWFMYLHWTATYILKVTCNIFLFC